MATKAIVAKALSAKVLVLTMHAEEDYLVTLHEWHPDGVAYPGLPLDLAEASQRRAERVTLEVVPRDSSCAQRAAFAHGLSPFCLDLRCL